MLQTQFCEQNHALSQTTTFGIVRADMTGIAAMVRRDRKGDRGHENHESRSNLVVDPILSNGTVGIPDFGDRQLVPDLRKAGSCGVSANSGGQMTTALCVQGSPGDEQKGGAMKAHKAMTPQEQYEKLFRESDWQGIIELAAKYTNWSPDGYPNPGEQLDSAVCALRQAGIAV